MRKKYKLSTCSTVQCDRGAPYANFSMPIHHMWYKSNTKLEDSRTYRALQQTTVLSVMSYYVLVCSPLSSLSMSRLCSRCYQTVGAILVCLSLEWYASRELVAYPIWLVSIYRVCGQYNTQQYIVVFFASYAYTLDTAVCFPQTINIH